MAAKYRMFRMMWGSGDFAMNTKTIIRFCLLSAVIVGCVQSALLAASVVGWGSQVVGVNLSGGFTAIAASETHSLGLKQDGSIVAWGRNYDGECNVPSPNTKFVAVAAGGYHSLGLKADGSIVAWGSNWERQCNVPSPNTGFVAVAAGGYHSLGLKADGSIVAWGSNQYGQCKIPSPNTGFVAVAAGGSHSLGLKAGGSIVAWGDDSSDKCNVPSPNTGFVAVAAGGSHSLGLKADGSIVAWGAGQPGQSGWPHYGQCNVPSPNTGFVAVAAGGSHSLGLKADGSIVAWGSNQCGQCNVPSPNTGFVAVAAGGSHSLGLKADGSIVAWGSNWERQCNVPSPNTGFVAVAAGGSHSLGLKAGGSIVAWGDDSSDQCNVPSPNTGFVAVAAGGSHSLGLKADGSIVAWGRNLFGQCSVPSPNTGFVAVGGGESNSLGLKADGSIVAWGFTWGSPSPNRGFLAVAAGGYHSLGLKYDGSIVAWGAGQPGQSGWPHYGQCNVPSPNTGFVGIAAGDSYSLALRGGELALAFTVRSVSPTHAGDLGPAAIDVIGSGFKQTTTVKLVPDTTELKPNEVVFVTPWKLQSRFDLTAAPLGKYDLVVTNPDGQFVILPQCFEIVEGGQPHLWTGLRVPPEVRPQRKYTAYVEYGNDGDLALPVPILKLSNTSGALMQLGKDGRESDNQILILGTGDRNGRHLLPGEHTSVTVRFTAPSTRSVDFTLDAFVPDDTPFPWDSVGELVRPVDASDEQSQAEWQEQTKNLGITWAEVLDKILDTLSDMPSAISKDFQSALIHTMVVLNHEEQDDFPSDFRPEEDVWIPERDQMDFDPSKNCTYVITHGWTGSAVDTPIVALRDKIKSVCPGCNVLRVNWEKGASSWLPNYAAMNILPAAQEASRKLKNLFGPGFDWNTITYIGHSFGNSVNKHIASSHGGKGKGIILDPANHYGYAEFEDYFEGAYEGGSVAVITDSLGDNGPCNPYPRRIADRQFRLPSSIGPAGHLRALDCFTDQIGACNNDWLTGQSLKTTTAHGPGWYDGIIDCDGDLQPGSAYAACSDTDIPVPAGDLTGGTSVVIFPIDPSEKRGNEGYDPWATPEDLRQHFVRPDERIEYTVFFENQPNATAPAQEVRIVDYLSPCLRWGSVELGEIVFGDHVVTTFAGKTSGHDVVTLKSTPYLVDIKAQFDPYTGRLSWTLRTIDPNTGELPDDPRVGLLPPNDPNHRGEGHVTFSISAQEDLPNAHISNRATIFFDTEAPFDVNVWLNTIDGSPPASAVLPLPMDTIPSRFEVRWSGDDGQGCGVANYDVYVATDSGAYETWLSRTTETSAFFVGLPGYSYRFYCVARDFLGNTEAPPLVPDTQTTLSSCFPRNFTTFNDWVALAKPECWCRKYQCDGDADGVGSGPMDYYRIFAGDLSLIVTNWKKKAGDPTLDPCADIDHKDSGALTKYRVFTGDLSVLVANWKKNDKDLPGNCPRPE